MKNFIKIIAILVFFVAMSIYIFTSIITAEWTVILLAVSGTVIVVTTTCKGSSEEPKVETYKDKAEARFQNRYVSGLRGKDLTDGLYDNL